MNDYVFCKQCGKPFSSSIEYHRICLDGRHWIRCAGGPLLSPRQEMQAAYYQEYLRLTEAVNAEKRIENKGIK